MSLSTHALDGMGFRTLGEGEQLNAAFHSAHVYEIRGVTIEDNSVIRSDGVVTGVAYTVGVGNGVNRLFKDIVGDDLTFDEAAWAKEHRCSPPYAVLHYGPTSMHTGAGRHVREEGSMLITYDSFLAAKQELRAIEAKVHPSAITALACSLGSLETPAKLLRVVREVYGITDTGRFLQDFRIQFTAEGYAPRRLNLGALQEALDLARQLAPRVVPKVARFFHLGMAERDPLKSFLYFFLAIEVETHAAFKSIQHSANIDRTLQIDSRVRESAAAWFESQQDRWTNLLDRFVWCAVCAWPQLTDADVTCFKELKKIRDDIAHGTVAEPPTGAVEQAKGLATKLLNKP